MVLPGHRVRLQRTVRVEVGAPGADDELAQTHGVRRPARGLRREVLVVVAVAVEDEIGPAGVQRVPERLDGTGVAAGGEERVVPVGQRAPTGVRGEVGPEPGLLRRALMAAADLGALRVQRDHVPCADVPGIVSARGITGGATEISVIAGSARCVVLVITRNRMGDRLEASPTRVVGGEFCRRAAVVLQIAQRENGRRIHSDDDVCRVVLPAFRGSRGITGSAGDVAGGRHDDRLLGHRGRAAAQQSGRGQHQRRSRQREQDDQHGDDRGADRRPAATRAASLGSPRRLVPIDPHAGLFVDRSRRPR